MRHILGERPMQRAFTMGLFFSRRKTAKKVKKEPRPLLKWNLFAIGAKTVKRLSILGTVKARTKSEARAMFKASMECKGRLPLHYVVVRAK